MFANFGILTPFMWHKEFTRIRSNVVYQMGSIEFSVNGTVGAVSVYDVETQVGDGANVEALSWQIKDETIECTKISYAGVVGRTYFILVQKDGENYYSDHIKITECTTTILANNTCNDVLFPWEFGGPIQIDLPNVQQSVPTVETTTEKRYSPTGAVDIKTIQIPRYGLQIIQPRAFANMLRAIKGLDDVSMNGNKIRNIEVEVTDANQLYSMIRITYEFYNHTDGNDCCDDIPIDDIFFGEEEEENPECEAWEIDIVRNDLTLSVVSTNEPTCGESEPKYRWYRNGVFLTTAEQIEVELAGNYRVEVTKCGCRKIDAYYIEDWCILLKLRVYKVGNWINADINGVKEECEPPEIQVLFNGDVVSTTLPYEATESGTYFVRVQACKCIRSGGVVVTVTDGCDFDVSIEREDLTLYGQTDAEDPKTYEWSFENMDGNIIIGAGPNVMLNKTGIYWFKVIQEDCEKETYYYYENEAECLPIRICNWDEFPTRVGAQDRFIGENGTEFTLTNIKLVNVNNFNTQIEVLRNGNNVAVYTLDTPTEPFQYTADIANNKIILSSDFAMDNENLIVNFRWTM